MLTQPAHSLRRLASVFVPVLGMLLGLTACQSAPTAGGSAAGGGVAHVAPTRATPMVIDPTHRAAVNSLKSPDFVERARASERLVQAGAVALPALGEVGSQPVLVHGEARVSTTRPVIQAILQAAEPADVSEHLRSAHAVVRQGAAEEVGRRGHWKPIPELIVRLEDANPDVRAAAAASLRRLTNNFFGYSASSQGRGAAVGRWKTWWTQEGSLRGRSDTDAAAAIARNG